MASNVEAPDRWYLALLGFAEHFRTSSPPKIRLCVHCLQAVFQFKPPQRIEARTHLQLGSVLYHHTKNSDLARSHLEKAVRGACVLGKSGDAAEKGDGSRPQAAKTADGGNVSNCCLFKTITTVKKKVKTWALVVSNLDVSDRIWSRIDLTFVHSLLFAKLTAVWGYFTLNELKLTRFCLLCYSGIYLNNFLNLKMSNLKLPAFCLNFSANR